MQNDKQYQNNSAERFYAPNYLLYGYKVNPTIEFTGQTG
jgi:hypothetical protein